MRRGKPCGLKPQYGCSGGGALVGELQRPRDRQSNSNHKLSALLFSSAAFVVFFSFYQFTAVSEPTRCTLQTLQTKYPQQENSIWRRLTDGIENIINKRFHSPQVILFVYSGGKGAIDLIRDIAMKSSSCFDLLPIELKVNDFTSASALEDYGHLIVNYKSKVKEGKVFLIGNLNEIPARSARALHTICDTVSPVAEDVIIYLSLRVLTIEKSAVETAVDTLTALWSTELDRNELDPLIARVTGQVFYLKS